MLSKNLEKLSSCSPDLTTNSETTIPIFHDFIDQLEQVLQVLLLFLVKTIWLVKEIVKIRDSGFVVSELVFGSGEQDEYWQNK